MKISQQDRKEILADARNQQRANAFRAALVAGCADSVDDYLRSLMSMQQTFGVFKPSLRLMSTRRNRL